MRTPASARRGLTIYFAVLVTLSAALEGWIITHGGLRESGLLVLVLMYVPLVASVVARLAGREGFGDVSFRWGGRTGTRAALTAWLLPVAIGLAAYGVAWSTGLASVSVMTDGPLAGIGSPALRLVAAIGLALTVGTLLSCVSAFGEEIGWRGYLVPRLVEAGVPAPYLTSALVWCFWHVPLILWGGYAAGPSPALSALLFIGAITPVGLLYARWRMATGSVWPAGQFAHGAWNIVIQSAPRSLHHRRRLGPPWIGESGILTVAALWLAYLLIRNAPQARSRATGRQSRSMIGADPPLLPQNGAAATRHGGTGLTHLPRCARRYQVTGTGIEPVEDAAPAGPGAAAPTPGFPGGGDPAGVVLARADLGERRSPMGNRGVGMREPVRLAEGAEAPAVGESVILADAARRRGAAW
ncbi:MAG: type II CAAX endopeptidase family protein [Gemmatimonadales bacterium]